MYVNAGGSAIKVSPHTCAFAVSKLRLKLVNVRVDLCQLFWIRRIERFKRRYLQWRDPSAELVNREFPEEPNGDRRCFIYRCTKKRRDDKEIRRCADEIY